MIFVDTIVADAGILVSVWLSKDGEYQVGGAILAIDRIDHVSLVRELGAGCNRRLRVIRTVVVC